MPSVGSGGTPSSLAHFGATSHRRVDNLCAWKGQGIHAGLGRPRPGPGGPGVSDDLCLHAAHLLHQEHSDFPELKTESGRLAAEGGLWGQLSKTVLTSQGIQG